MYAVYSLSPHIVNTVVYNLPYILYGSSNKKYNSLYKTHAAKWGLDKILEYVYELSHFRTGDSMEIKGPIVSLSYRLLEAIKDDDKYMEKLLAVIEDIGTHLLKYKTHKIIRSKIKTLTRKYNTAKGRYKEVYSFLINLSYALVGLHAISHYSKGSLRLTEKQAKKIIEDFKSDLVVYVSYLIYGKNYFLYADQVESELSDVLKKISLNHLQKDAKNIDSTKHPLNRLIMSVVDSLERYIIYKMPKR